MPAARPRWHAREHDDVHCRTPNSKPDCCLGIGHRNSGGADLRLEDRPGSPVVARPIMEKPNGLPQQLRGTSVEGEVALEVERFAGELRRGLQHTLKPYGVTGVQYEVLRILQGAEPDGLPCSEVARRMVSYDPDVTRLLARLQRAGLTEWRRDTRDKRVRFIRISREGLRLARQLEPIIRRQTRKALRHMGPEKLRLLADLLKEAQRRTRSDGSGLEKPVAADVEKG